MIYQRRILSWISTSTTHSFPHNKFDNFLKFQFQGFRIEIWSHRVSRYLNVLYIGAPQLCIDSLLLIIKFVGSQVSSQVKKLVGSQVYRKVQFLVKQKTMIIILMLKHSSSFSSQNSNCVFSIPDLLQKNPQCSLFSIHTWFGK